VKRALLVPALLLLLMPALIAGNAFLGVYLSNLTMKQADELGLADNNGVRITSVVENSPAKAAGIRKDDVIIAIDSDKIYTHDQLTKILEGHNPGDVIKLKLMRDGKVKSVKLTLIDREDWYTKKVPYMGVYLEDLSQKEYDALGLSGNYGIKISKVLAGEAAEAAGIQTNDILLMIDSDKIYTIDQLTKILRNHQPKDAINVTVYRDGSEKKLKLILGEKTVKTNIFWNEPLNTQVFHFLPNQKYIGLDTSDLTEKLMKKYKIESGIYIDKVIEDSPADSAGLQERDIIIKIDGRDVETAKDLKKALKAHDPGDKINLTVLRKGKEKKVDVVIRQRKYGLDDFNISIDNGEIHIINGDKELNFDFNELEKNLKDMEILKKIKIKELQDDSRELEVEERDDDEDVIIYRKQLI